MTKRNINDILNIIGGNEETEIVFCPIRHSEYTVEFNSNDGINWKYDDNNLIYFQTEEFNERSNQNGILYTENSSKAVISIKVAVYDRGDGVYVILS